MIVIHNPSWLRIMFHLRGSSASRIWRRWLLVVVAATVITALHHYGWYPITDLTLAPFTLIGLALSIFLGFRNNTSYDRFWEGRKLWGRVVNASRTLARDTLMLVGGEQAPKHQQRMVYTLMAYVHALRHHLRRQDRVDELHRFVGEDVVTSLKPELNRPVALLQNLGDDYAAAWRRGDIETFHLPTLQASLTELTGVQGGCERILNTPIPFSYTVLMHRIVAAYCFLLPLGLVHSLDLYTPVVVGFISFAFLGLDALGDEIEDPFGEDANDLPLLQLSTMIEHNLRQRLGETELPTLITPVDEVLS